MQLQYCPYCGKHLNEGCTCEADAAEIHNRFVEDYENRPDVQAGWAQQDLIDSYRRER
jgi:hypothetical protein